MTTQSFCTGNCRPQNDHDPYVCWPIVQPGCTCHQNCIQPRGVRGNTCHGGCRPAAPGWCGCACQRPVQHPCTCCTCHDTPAQEDVCEQCMDWDCALQCPFLDGCKHPMTHEEMCRLLRGICYGRLILCLDGIFIIEPVCCSVRECSEGTIFTLRLRTDSAIMDHLHACVPVTLQFDRQSPGALCTVQATGVPHITGSSNCVSIVEVTVNAMAGECYHRCGGCQNSCGGTCGNCQNN